MSPFAMPLAARGPHAPGARLHGAASTAAPTPTAVRLPSLLPPRSRAAPSTSRCGVIAAAAPAETADKPRPGEKKGFVEEMRFVAMKLHTKDQAPKEGEREAAANPWAEWKPTRAGYLRFLSESLAVYEALEEAVASNPAYAPFRGTGLERTAALRADIAWFEKTYGLVPPPLDPAGPGATYAKLVKELAASDPPAFICHFYNTYFAHTAGGRMIGAKLGATLLDGTTLAFYRYDGDFRPLLDVVRARIDDAAAGWSREDKDRCLDETAASFKNSGALLRLIAEKAE